MARAAKSFLFGGLGCLGVALLCLTAQSRAGGGRPSALYYSAKSHPSALFYKSSGLTWAERDAIAKVGAPFPVESWPVSLLA